MANAKTASLVTITDLTDAPIGILSNESFVLAADLNGVVGSFSGASTTLSIKLGGVDDSANWSVSAGTPVGITGSLAGKTYTVTAMSSDIGYVDLTASRAGFSNIVKRFSVAKAKQGANGTAGVSITSVDVEYGNSSSATTAPASWSTTAPTWESGKYIWSRVKTTYSSGSPTYTNAACITGQSGTTGRGITSIVEQYAVSTSKTTEPSDASFSTNRPTWEPGKYVWTRSLITYTSGSPATSTTTAIVNSEWEAVNEVKVGGRNFCRNTNKGALNWTWSMQTGDKTIASLIENGVDTCLMTRGAVAQSGWSVIQYSDIGRSLYEPNSDYIVSFDVKSSVNCWFSAQLILPNGISQLAYGVTAINNAAIAGQWSRIIITLKTGASLPSDTGQLLYLTGMLSTPGVTYQFKNLKIEKGNKPTDWTPAPEDVQEQIDESLAVAKSKSEMIFSAEYADRETLLPLDAGTLVFFSNQKQTYRYEGYIEGVHEWNNVTYDLVGPLAGDLSNLQTQLGTRTTVFTRDTAPTIGTGGEAKAGDMWVNTSNANKVYILFGGSWTLFNQSEFDSVQSVLDNITKTMTGGSTIWRQDTQPASGMVNGDLWFNTTSGMNNQCKKYNGTSWILFDFTTLLSYVETKSDSWKNADQLYAWIKDSAGYKSALEAKLDTSIYTGIIQPALSDIPGIKTQVNKITAMEADINDALANDVNLSNRLDAYNVYIEYQEPTPGQPNSDYLRIARLDAATGVRSGFEIRITNTEIGFYRVRVDANGVIEGTDKLAYANGLEFRMINATITKQINLMPTEAPLGAAGGQQYFQLLATTDGAFQGLWVTDT